MKNSYKDKIKIAFFDIDGTMIDMKKKVMSEKMIETLNRLKENGIIICVATGRSPMTLPKFEKIAFDAFLTFNGSLCYNQKETIFGNPIPAEDVRLLIRNAERMGRPLSLATKKELGANGMDQDLIDYYAIAELDVRTADDFEAFSREEIYQIMLGCREEEYEDLLVDVKGAKIAAWWDRAVDVIPADGGKGRGIASILAYYGFSKEEAIAFGDGNNDIEMLETVGLGVAMANASDRLKAVADEVCGHVAEDGIYHYCLEHGLI